MKKTLLLTTSLVGLGLATTAYAADVATPAEEVAAPATLTTSGYFSSGFFIYSNDSVADEVGKSVSTDGEIQFTGTLNLENGMTAGVRVELEAFTSTDQIDEHYIYLTSGFGTIKLGAEDAASNLLSVNGPFYGIGTGADAPTYNAGVLAITGTATRFSGDANKFTYLTPDISGFQAGVSFTPSTTNSGGHGGGTEGNIKTVSTAAPTTAPLQDVLSAGVKYSGDFGGIGLGISAGMETGKSHSDATAAQEKRTVTAVGLNLTVAGANIGARYSIDKHDTSAGTTTVTSNKNKALNISASYALTGDLTIGAGFFTAKDSASLKSTRMGAGVKYNLGSGVNAALSFTQEKQQVTGASDTKASLIGVELGASF